MKEQRKKGTLLYGDLEAMDLATLVQQLNGDVKARILLDRGGEKAEVYVDGGRVLHARVGSRKGEEAFFYLLTWHDGEFVVEKGEPQEVTIGEEVSLLLLRGAHVLDEVMEEKEEDYLPLVRELEQIPAVRGGGVYYKGKVKGLSFPQVKDLIQAIEDLGQDFSWGEMRPWRDGKLVLVRRGNVVFFFHVDLGYDPRKLFRVIERRFA